MSENVKKIIKWVLLDKNPPLVKFENDEESYVISDNVIAKSDFAKYPLKKGDETEVGIIGNEVTFLKKVNKFNKTKTDTPAPSSEEVKKTLTVAGVYQGESVKFKEEDINGKKWTKLSPELQGRNLKDLGVIANNKIIVTLVNGIITAIEQDTSVKEEAPEETTAKTNTYTKPKSGSYRDEGSMDKRTALMVAKDIVVALVAMDKIDKEKIGVALDELTKASFKSLIELE